MAWTAISRGACVLLVLAAAGCISRGDPDRNLDALDNELTDAGAGNAAADPAMRAALHDQIMVDPKLTQQANGNTVRPPAQPYSAAVPADNVAQGAGASGTATSIATKSAPAPKGGGCPGCDAARQSLTLGALASRQSDRHTASCAGALRYSATWADRLPADLPLYPGARVSEAAGADSAACHVRAVSFSTEAKLQTVVDYYYTRTTGAGYSAEHQADGGEHVLGGTRARDGGAYVFVITARRDGGTDIDLIANNGR